MPARGHRSSEMNLEFFGVSMRQIDAEVYEMEAKALEEDPRSLKDIVAAELSKYDDEMAKLKSYRVDKQQKLKGMRDDAIKWGNLTLREKNHLRFCGLSDRISFARANRKLDRVIKAQRAVVEQQTIANRSKDPAQRDKANKERGRLAKKSDKAVKALQRYAEKKIKKWDFEGFAVFRKERYLSARQEAMGTVGTDIVGEYTSDQAARAQNAHKANVRAHAAQTLARLRAEYLSKERSQPEMTSDAREQDEFRRETLEKRTKEQQSPRETRVRFDLRDKGVGTARRAPATNAAANRPRRDRSREQFPTRYRTKPQPGVSTQEIKKG